MRGKSTANLLYDPEVERTCRSNRKQAKERKQQQKNQQKEISSSAQGKEEKVMAGNGEGNRRTLGDYANHTVNRHVSSIVRPPVTANNFEIKPALLHVMQQNQFGGSEIDDPNIHISNFLEICDTLKINGASDDAIRLRLFPFSLRDRAKSWLQSQPRGSITTWDELETRFLGRYFPPSRFVKMRGEITSFVQRDGEILHDAWERFKELLRKCPNHGFDDLQQMQIFCNGLRPATKLMLDASAGGSMNSKTAEEAQQLIEAMASNDYLMHNDRGVVAKKGIMELDSQSALLAQNKLMTQQLEALTKQI